MEVSKIDTIKYSDGTVTITMPRTRPVTVGGELKGKTLTLAGGRTVMEVTGFRPSFTAEWDYVPQDTLTILLTMLRKTPFLTVTYSDPVNGVVGEVYQISYPTVSVWRYRNGVPVWHDVKITHKRQELM